MARFFTLFSIAVIALAGFAQATENQQGSADGQVGRSGQDGNIQINGVLPNKRDEEPASPNIPGDTDFVKREEVCDDVE